MPRPEHTEIVQPDGRQVYLYGDFAPAPPDYEAPRMPTGGVYQRRWNPLRREWVLVAASRQARTFLPERPQCPLCPSKPGQSSEIPASRFNAAVFDNRFPAMMPARPGGKCEVVVYTDEHEGSFGSLPEDRLQLLSEVWTDRYRALSTAPGIRYVYIFENRGEQVGVTLHHPHGQIYAYPFLPPVALSELRRTRNGCLQCRLIEDELEGKRRILLEAAGIVAYVPGYARWPYEVHLAPRAHRPSLLEITAAQRLSLLQAMQKVVRAYDRLFDVPMPYMMAMHQAPLRYAQAHLHIEFYPILRDRGKLKYLAGTESGSGVFINDTLAEESADRLRPLIG